VWPASPPCLLLRVGVRRAPAHLVQRDVADGDAQLRALPRRCAPQSMRDQEAPPPHPSERRRRRRPEKGELGDWPCSWRTCPCRRRSGGGRSPEAPRPPASAPGPAPQQHLYGARLGRRLGGQLQLEEREGAVGARASEDVAARRVALGHALGPPGCAAAAPRAAQRRPCSSTRRRRTASPPRSIWNLCCRWECVCGCGGRRRDGCIVCQRTHHSVERRVQVLGAPGPGAQAAALGPPPPPAATLKSYDEAMAEGRAPGWPMPSSRWGPSLGRGPQRFCHVQNRALDVAVVEPEDGVPGGLCGRSPLATMR